MQDQAILNYLRGTSSQSEEKEIQDWILSSDENAKKFNLLKAKHIASTFGETAPNVEVEKKLTDFLSTISSSSSAKSNRIIPFLKYAAMISMILGFGYIYLTDFFVDKPAKLTINSESVKLKSDDGDVKFLVDFGQLKIKDKKGKILGVQSGNTITFIKHESTTDSLVYNSLIVPYGKRFNVILSDGTKVQLNSGSTLKYPTYFISGLNRQVFLDGEALFDVASDKKHPFIVNTKEINVKVLGTKFNVSSYPEDDFIRTVLVEGSVSLSKDLTKKETFKLKPGHEAIWYKQDKKMLIEEVDTSLYTSWVEGKIVFRHMLFKNIIKKLERHYNVKINSRNNVLNEETFTASFDIETIEQVLDTFSKNYSIQYTIKDNQIIIN